MLLPDFCWIPSDPTFMSAVSSPHTSPDPLPDPLPPASQLTPAQQGSAQQKEGSRDLPPSSSWLWTVPLHSRGLGQGCWALNAWGSGGRGFTEGPGMAAGKGRGRMWPNELAGPHWDLLWSPMVAALQLVGGTGWDGDCAVLPVLAWTQWEATAFSKGDRASSILAPASPDPAKLENYLQL